jgi:precorrin-6A/cobalt-precorrin-6A reductase
MSKPLWLIGGTSESREIARAIAPLNMPVTITVTTPEAIKLYEEILIDHALVKVWVGILNDQNLSEFYDQQKFAKIIDASHPYATEISQLAINFSHNNQIPYLRYERSPVNITEPVEENIIYLENFTDLINGEYLTNQRVFLTTGYKTLHLFQSWQERATLFTRILPNINTLQATLNLGFTPDRIVAIRPPISAELEIALWQHWQISLVVTKASGQAGGEKQKRAIARQLNIPLIIIQRPLIEYPDQTDDLQQAIAFCTDHLDSRGNS